METIEIITLAPEAWPAYRQLRLEALQDSPQAFVSTYANMLARPDSFWQERLRAAQEDPNNWLLFARENGRLVGMMGAFRVETSDSVDIVSVYVSPQYRGRGVASALMAALLADIARAPGVKKAKLGVTAVQAPAIALYRRFGFAVVAELEAVMSDGIKYTEYLMEMSIGPQEETND